MAPKNLAQERIGTVGKNTYGSIMVVEKYNKASNVLVRFIETGNKVHTNWERFGKGEVTNPYDRTVFGVGYIGEGKYKTRENGKMTKRYNTWNGMLERCYSKDLHKKYPTYIGCSVTENWHNFQVFSAWYDDNFYKLEGEIMELDKDILFKGNKIYSPENCVFVSKNINSLFIKSNSIRGKFPIGVYFHKATKKYLAQCKIGNCEREYMGCHNTPEEAFVVYKKFKEKYIKKIADKYKDKIPSKLYNAMLNYIVEITD